jgi:hypothetical protein
MLFRVLGGNHVQDGVTYKKGEVIDTPMDLCGKFKGKFERVYHNDLTSNPKEAAPDVSEEPEIPLSENGDTDKQEGGGEDADAAPPASEEEDTEDDEAEDEEPEVPVDVDVTKKFAIAGKAGLTVIQTGRVYSLYDGDDRVGKKKLTSKKKVREAIAAFMEQ